MNQGNHANLGYVYTPTSPFNQEQYAFQTLATGKDTDKGKMRYESFYWTRLWYILSFVIHVGLSIALAAVTLIAIGKSKGNLPLLRTLYTSKYGDLPDTIHPTLFGYTTILRDKDTGFKPVPAIPVSFNDLDVNDATRRDSYYRCVDGTLNYTKEFGTNDRDVIRAKGICLVERFSNIATYQNHESSMTFSSTWSPVFMFTVALCISSSWQLLYIDFNKIPLICFSLRKKYVWVFWHALTFLFIVFCSYARIDDYMLPRNNIWFASVILLFSIIQQIVMMEKYGDRANGDKDHIYANTNFVENLYMGMHEQNVQAKQAKEDKKEHKHNYLSDKKLGVIVLLSDWFLLPLFFLSMFSIMSYNTLEWVFQATYIRFQLIIFGFVLLQQIRVIEEAFALKKSITNWKNFNVTDYEFHPRVLIFIAIVLAIASEIVSMEQTLKTQLDHGVTFLYALFYIIIFCVYVFALMFLVLYPTHLTGNRSTYINIASSVVRIVFFFMVIIFTTTEHNKYSCTFRNGSKNLFCGHANAVNNLNRYDYLSPIALTTSNVTAAYQNIVSSVTYSPLF